MGNTETKHVCPRDDNELSPSFGSTCWVVHPDGCARSDAVKRGTEWMVDEWGQSNGYGGPIGCARRQQHINDWCGTSTALTHYGPFAPSKIVPPSSEVTTNSEGRCWFVTPSGCPNGDGSGPSMHWKRDDWGMNNGYVGHTGCKRREGDLEAWCGVDDIVTHYGVRTPLVFTD